MTASTYGSRLVAIDAQVTRCDPGGIARAIFNGRALGLGGTWGEGQSRSFLNTHALGCARRAPELSLLTIRSLSGFATPVNMAGSASVNIWPRTRSSELCSRAF